MTDSYDGECYHVDTDLCLLCNVLHKQFVKSQLDYTWQLYGRAVFADRMMPPSLIS